MTQAGSTLVTLGTPDGFQVSFSLAALDLMKMATRGASRCMEMRSARPEATDFASFLSTPVYPEGIVRAIREAREWKAGRISGNRVIRLRTANTDEVE